MPELPKTAWFEIVPDWVCEVASPSTAAFDRADKMPVYARAGVKFAWIVEPSLQTLETYALENNRWVLLETFRGARGVRAITVRRHRARARCALGSGSGALGALMVVSDVSSRLPKKVRRRAADVKPDVYGPCCVTMTA